MNQPSARAETQAQKELRVQDRESTYFWFVEHDEAVCNAYIRVKYPDSKARRVSVINMHRLHERSHVIGLSRRGKPTPIEKYTIELGRRLPVAVDPDTLVGEVTEGQAVAVKDFISGATEWEDGQLDAPALIARMAKDYSPATCHYRADDGKAYLYGA